jgi:hypothetical protein
VVRDATIEDMSQAVFSASPLGGYIIRPTKLSSVIYVTDCKEGFVIRKLQRGLSSMETWHVRWNIKINEDQTRDLFLSQTSTA